MCVMACTFTADTTSSEKPWPSEISQNALVRSASPALNVRRAGASACPVSFGAGGRPSTVSP